MIILFGDFTTRCNYISSLEAMLINHLIIDVLYFNDTDSGGAHVMNLILMQLFNQNNQLADMIRKTMRKGILSVIEDFGIKDIFWILLASSSVLLTISDLFANIFPLFLRIS